MRRREEDFHDGAADGLVPLSPLDINQVKDCDELLAALSRTAFGGRNLGEAAEVLHLMVTDPECTIVGTFSGAMTVAKMGLLICEMIDRGWLKVIISTGALMAHGLIEAVDRVHYKYDPRQSDQDLYCMGYNRVYDTLEMEKNLDYAEQIFRNVLERMDKNRVLSSEIICAELGRYLAESTDQPGVLRNAYLAGVPVFIPAFTDSELGLDVANWMIGQAIRQGQKIEEALTAVSLNFNPFLDLGRYGQEILKAKKLGIFTIGGGVPRNWAQQVGPFFDILQNRLEIELPFIRFQYGVRICPEPVHWGGLSGCTYQEGVSWGKFVPPQEGGRFAEVLCDATIAWPILLKAVIQRVERPPTP
ncbi:MAG: deoxyhypusine synthase family protein [Deltaproteobacteria bacterium]|nr:deoxyhypusine synthase family protein [Deltaproteobacteria bacterium]MBW1952649.1 deoxyhypusine synthase family protein [Deltaproteobacteria bacterium]MBW1986223.1 deoxyhypusine synthase family protein [Deltaproteobacteria bacterium]MBW2134120.1 deoxyhypusine synthase family protein [Deltaproteobacteria bacterium]